MKTFFPINLLLLICLNHYSVAQADLPNTNTATTVAEAQKDAKKLFDQRQVLISSLLNSLQDIDSGLKDPLKQQNAATAMLLLGELKATEAIPLLIKNLVFSGPIPFSLQYSQYAGRPAVEALVDIGPEALDQIIENYVDIDQPSKEEEAYSALILRLVLKSGPVAHAYVEEYRKNNVLLPKQQIRIDALLKKL